MVVGPRLTQITSAPIVWASGTTARGHRRLPLHHPCSPSLQAEQVGFLHRGRFIVTSAACAFVSAASLKISSMAFFLEFQRTIKPQKSATINLLCHIFSRMMLPPKSLLMRGRGGRMSRKKGLGENDLLLALDLGTSSSRAILYDAHTVQAVSGAAQAVKHAASVTPDGGATLDANALVSEMATCIESVLARAQGRRIAGVAVSTFWHSFLGIDKDGAAKTPIFLWNDTRAKTQADFLRQRLDNNYTQRTGCQIHTSYPPARLLWLAQTNPEVFAACDAFVSPGEFFDGTVVWARTRIGVVFYGFGNRPASSGPRRLGRRNAFPSPRFNFRKTLAAK